MTLHETTTALRARGRKALVPFFTAGYPDEDTFVALVEAAVGAGADVVEVGIPFSDPIADGPVIQATSTAALARGMTLRRALALVDTIHGRTNASLVAMSYLNPILAMGVEQFAAAAAGAGLRGLILPDVPREESADLRTVARGAGLDYIDMVAPTSSDARIAAITRDATGFVYMVSVAGVTGARDHVAGGISELVARVRAHCNTPAYVGFGISTPAQAAEVAEHADGVIIGSRLVERIDGARDASGAVERVGAFLGEVRRALDAGAPPGAP